MLDSLARARRRAAAAWIVPTLLASLLFGSFAVAAGSLHAAPGREAFGSAGAGLGAGDRRVGSAAAVPAGTAGPITAALVETSPFFPNGDGIRELTSLSVTLDAPAHLDVTVLDFSGSAVRHLATDVDTIAGTASWPWDGKAANGKVVVDGPYLMRVTARTDAGTFQVERWVTKAKLVPYESAAAGAVVVALDPGHGGKDPGAYYKKTRESNMNLDIGLRLRQMLEAAGVTVVMTRSEDRAINDPPVDVSGNGQITHGDELIIRNDIANLARADVHVVLMNNAYGCHCAVGTETYTSGERSWTPEGVDLARFIQSAHITRLRAFKSKAWKPKDRGVKLWDYAAIRPYERKKMPRPSLMPSVLVESLFMDHANELAVLRKATTRAALAAAYYDGIARWLAMRPFGLRYDVLDATATAEVGKTAAYRMQLTNRGNQTSAGWILEARMVTATSAPYDGSPVRGTLVAQMPIPDGLAPGQATEIDLSGVPVPAAPGNWRLKFDVRLPDDATLQDHGVVGPQLPLTTTDVPPPPSPSPEPTPEITPEPTVEITPEPRPEITPEPTVEITPEPTVEITPEPSPSEILGAGSGSAPANPTEPSEASSPQSVAVSVSLFGHPLPRDPFAGRPGSSVPIRWAGRQPWMRYITPIDIAPDRPFLYPGRVATNGSATTGGQVPGSGRAFSCSIN